jgi:hypothetical protein
MPTVPTAEIPAGFFIAKGEDCLVVVSEKERDIYDNPISFVVETGARYTVKETLGGLRGIEYEEELLEIKKLVSKSLKIPFDGRFLFVESESLEKGIFKLFPVCLTIVEAWRKRCPHKVESWQRLYRKIKENPYHVIKLSKAERIAELFGISVESLPFKFYGNKAYLETVLFLRAIAEGVLSSLNISNFLRKMTIDRREIERIYERLTWITALMVGFAIDGENRKRTKFSFAVYEKFPWLKEWLKKSEYKHEIRSLLEAGAIDPEQVRKLVKPIALELGS